MRPLRSPGRETQNTNISISDNGVHIDRGVQYTNITLLTANGGVAHRRFAVPAAYNRRWGALDTSIISGPATA